MSLVLQEQDPDNQYNLSIERHLNSFIMAIFRLLRPSL